MREETKILKSSLFIEEMEIKDKFQIFTPDIITNKMLNYLSYENDNILDKLILESSCGSGNIIVEIVQRLIIGALKKRKTSSEITLILENNVYGVEKDKTLYDICIKRLNKLCQTYEINSPKWNIVNDDGLKTFNKIQFDYIIGNPPYIRYHSLSKETRLLLKNNYKSCRSGLFDYYFAFVEDAYLKLKDGGEMIFLLPESLLTTKSGTNIRNMLIDDLIMIHNFKNEYLFKNINTSSVIIQLKKEAKVSELKLITDNNSSIISKEKLIGDKWILDVEDSYNNEIKFGQYFHAYSSVATQANEIFIVEESTIERFNLEKKILKKAENPKNQKVQKNLKIIFPYECRDGKFIKMNESEFESEYPNISNYLKQNMYRLSRRNTKAEWYEYGRSQSLNHLFIDKIIISSTISNNTIPYFLDSETVPFGGIVIRTRSKYNLKVAYSALSSQKFYNYARRYGVSINGGFIRISASMINNFTFEEEEFELWQK